PRRCKAMITSLPSSPLPSSMTLVADGERGVPRRSGAEVMAKKMMNERLGRVQYLPISARNGASIKDGGRMPRAMAFAARHKRRARAAQAKRLAYNIALYCTGFRGWKTQ